MSLTQELLAELSGLNPDVDEDDPIANVALAQARAEATSGLTEDVDADDEAASVEPAAPAATEGGRRWRGSKLLRTSEDAATAAAPSDPGDPGDVDDPEAVAAVEAALRSQSDEAQRGVAHEEASDAEPEGDDENATAIALLTDIRALLRQQVRLLTKLVGEGRTTVEAPVRPRVTRVESKSAPRAAAVVASTAEPAAPPSSRAVAEGALSRSEQVQMALSARQERQRARAEEERQRRAELIAAGLSPEEAMARLEEAAAARAEAAEDEADASDDALLDEVPMAATGVPSLDDPLGGAAPAAQKPAGSKGSRADGFDVDFDVSALSGAKGR